MNKKSIFLFFIFFFLFINCSSFNKKNNTVKNNNIIRHVNLKAIYNYLANKDQELKRLVELNKSRIKEIKLLEKNFLFEKQKGIYLSLSNKKEELKKTGNEIRLIKTGIYKKINSAVNNIAKKYDIDFILNIGNETIFAKNKYDITDEVIREILKTDKRLSPVSR